MAEDYTAATPDSLMTNTPRYVPRATRVSLPSWILYRPAGEVRWREGRVENVSQSGVLFHGAERVHVEMPVEVMMAVPAEVGGGVSGTSLGRGHIVRLGTERSDARPTFAAAITGWEAVQTDPRRI
jgi:hypothetical protein